MTTHHKNESPVSAGQFVKTLSKCAANFIARCKLFASGFYLNKGIDAGLIVAFALLLVQVGLVAVWGAL